MSTARDRKIGQLQSLPIPTTVSHTVGIDRLCHLSKFLIAEALPDGSAQQVASFLVEDLILRYSASRVLISDQGRTFLSYTIQQANRICGPETRRTSSFHPQTNGLCERIHRTLVDSVSKFVNERKTDWNDLLPFVIKANNTVPQKSTRFSAFFLVYGFEAESTFVRHLPVLPVKTLDGTEYAEKLMEPTPEH